MAVQLTEKPSGRVLEVHLSGKLTHEDYERFGPEVEDQIKLHGKVRLLVEMIDFHGWQAGALWDDIKFDLKHFRDIDRLAIVGDKKWEHGMATFCKPFTSAKVRYFDAADEDEARAWLDED